MCLPSTHSRTSDLGKLLAERQTALVYGGGAIGLMGRIADSYVANGGQRLIGVVPEQFSRLLHARLTEVRITESMHQRKHVMFELADSFITLPGGLGTIEEMLEILTLSRLGMHGKPIGLLNVAGYYDALLAFLDHMAQHGFCLAQDREMLIVDDSPERLLDKLDQYKPPAIEKWWMTAESGARSR